MSSLVLAAIEGAAIGLGICWVVLLIPGIRRWWDEHGEDR